MASLRLAPVSHMIVMATMALPLWLQMVAPAVNAQKYNATWESIDSRPLPEWYDEGKFGIFIVWGIYSVPSYGSEWFWWYWQGNTPKPAYVEFMKNNYPPKFTYADFASQFHAEFYNASDWAELFEASGAKYDNLTLQKIVRFTQY